MHPPSRFDASFLASQQRKLIAARDALSSSIARDGGEDRLLELAAGAQANESEDRAQDATASDNNRLLVDVLTARRTSIERALAKIDEGTYGYSDVSGLAIPRDRLEAYPEALRTVGEALVTAREA
jgi:DnaK suppressor protein